MQIWGCIECEHDRKDISGDAESNDMQSLCDMTERKIKVPDRKELDAD